MADRKISELNAADSANLHDSALLHVVDTTEALAVDQNVKATIAQAKSVFGTVDAFDVSIQSPSTTLTMASGDFSRASILVVTVPSGYVLKLKRLRFRTSSIYIAARIENNTDTLAASSTGGSLGGDEVKDVALSSSAGDKTLYFGFSCGGTPGNVDLLKGYGAWFRLELEPV
jgi:hypothetical protein